MTASLFGLSLAELGQVVEGNRNRIPDVATIRKRKDREGWWIFWRDERGGRKARSAPTRKLAEQLKAAVSTELFLVKNGLVTRERHQQQDWSRRPIADSITDYLDYLRRNKRCNHHVKVTAHWLNLWVTGAGVRTLQDVEDLDRTDHWLAEVAEARGWSARTYNACLVALRAFVNRMVTLKRMTDNPFRKIVARNVKADKVRPSRAFTPEELEALIEACPNSHRRTYYELSGRLGLRWSEIGRLDWSYFNFDKNILTLPAKITKNRIEVKLPVPQSLIDTLQNLRREAGPLFAERPGRLTWIKDLIRAGIVKVKQPLKGLARYRVENLDGYVTKAGQIDRKSLRKTFCTHLALAGVDLRKTQQLMRHQDVNLTAEIYTDAELLDLRSATEKAAALGSKSAA